MHAPVTVAPCDAPDLAHFGAHDRVEARIAELMGVINTATADLVALIEDVLHEGTWERAGGIRSPEHWVMWQCGVSSRRARGLVQMARRRAELSHNAALFDAGQLTEDAMALIARRVPVARDAGVAEQAPRLLYTQLSRFLETLPAPDAPEPRAPSDSVEFGVDDGRWRLRANLSIDDGALVEKALTAARSEVFHERDPDDDRESRCASKVTWVDGLVRVAERALGALSRPSENRPADRFQVILHVDVRDKTAMLHLGSVVPDSIRRYLACDADVRTMIEGNGVLGAVSTRMRTVDDRMRIFVENRDQGCRMPGCGVRRWLHIHHIEHWEDGGRTEPGNLCALCPLHHRMHHAGLLRIDGDPTTRDGLAFRDDRGRVIGPRAPAPPGRPPDPPPRPYVHPSGEPVDWRWVAWADAHR